MNYNYNNENDLEFDEIYQEIVFSHSKKPRNYGILPNCQYCEKGHNPSCGDLNQIFLDIQNNTIKDIKFIGEGCALSVSSCSIMTEIIKGKSLSEAKFLISLFVSYVSMTNIDKNTSSKEIFELLDNYPALSIFEKINNMPLRAKCVLLGWRTLEKIILNLH